MKIVGRTFVMALALYAANASFAIATVNAANPMLTDAGKAGIAKVTTAATERGDVPGVVTVIVNRDGVLYEGAAGKQDAARGVAMPPNAIFRIASMTKPVTSVAIMMLVDAGKVKLDDPVSKYLPEFKGRPVMTKFNAADATYETRPAKREITIRHLITHTSGFGYAFTDPTIKKIVDTTKKTEPELPLMQDPGVKWQYSASTRVLGWVVEKVSGEKLDVFLQKQIFEPLKMTDTAHAVPAAKVSRVVTIHGRKNGKLTESPNDPKQEFPVRGDGGLYSTAQDYTRFVRMFLNNGTLDGAKILSAKAVQMMSENPAGGVIMQTQPDANPDRTRPFPVGAGKDKFGLGFQITAADPQYAKYRSPGSLSWGGIYNTHFWIDPKRQIAGIVLMQVLPFYDEASMGVLRGIEEVVYQHLK
jgi:CubicO group peptidase (beta-lactamase class C family)